MSHPSLRSRPNPRRARALFSGIVTVLLGSILATGIAGTANAAGVAVDLTVTVTSTSGVPLTGIDVYAEPVSNGNLDFARYYVSGEVKATPVVGRPGTYLLTDIASDEDFTLYFDAPTATGTFSQFYGGTSAIDRATVLSYPTGAHSLSVSLATNAKITGKAVSSAAKGIPNIQVYAYRFDGTEWVESSAVQTASTGVYTLSNLDPGSYKLEFRDYSSIGYLTEYSGDKATLEAATTYYVGLGETVTSNVGLAVGGTISGTVLWQDAGGAELTNGVVPVAYKLLGTAPSFTSPDFAHPHYGNASSNSGVWTIPALPAGTYVVQLLDEEYNEALDTFVLAGGDNGASTWNAARKIVVGAGAKVSVGSTTLTEELLRDFTATVTGPGGIPIEGAYVQLWSDDDADRYYAASDGTDADGVVTIAQIHPGRYSIGVTVPDTDGNALFSPNVDIRSLADLSDYNYTVSLAALDPLAVDSLTITNTAVSPVGTTYEANATASLAHATLDYQWLRNGFPIFGARGASYTSTGGDVGKSISVRVRANAWGYYPAYANAVVDNPVTEGDAATNLIAPSILSSTVEAQPGSTLTAQAGSWSIPGVGFRYQWLRDSTPIGGQFAGTYVVQPHDALTSISVEVTAVKTGFADSLTAETDAVLIAKNPAPVVKTAPVLTSKALSGGRTTYTLSTGTWNVSGLTYAYQWKADGGAIAGATASSFTYSPAGAYAGQAITVTLTVTRAGYVSTERTVSVRKGVAVPTIAVPASVANATLGSVPGTVRVGDRLTAQLATLTYPGAGSGATTTLYQWQFSSNAGVSWVSIYAATKSTYTVPLAYNGKLLRVSMTTSSKNYSAVSVAAVAGQVALSDVLSSSTPPLITIAGSGSVGTVHTATVGGPWAVSAVVLSYQWQSCDSTCGDEAHWSSIAGATAKTLSPVVSLSGDQLRVVVTAKKTGFEPLSVVALLGDPLSSLTAVTPLTPPSVVGAVSGNAKVGVTLTARAGTVDVVTPTRSYAWESSPDGVSWTPVGLGLTYTPTAAVFVGGATTIRVVETSAKAGLTPGVSESAPVNLVQNQVVVTVLPKVTASGGTLTVSNGTWSPSAGLIVDVEWFVDGVSDGTTSTHALGAPGSAITVDVTATVPGYGEKTVRVLAQRGAAPTVVPSSTVTGSQYGDTLLAPTPFTYPASAHPATTYTYQWYVGSSAITGATRSTFKPSTTYIGKSIKVKVTAVSPYYSTQSAVSLATLFTKRSAVATVIVTTPGVVEPGAKLTAVPTLPTTGMTLAYRWQTSIDGISWASLTGKTASTYTVSFTDPGKFLRVQVVANKSGYNSVIGNSAALSPAFLRPLAPVTVPTISGPGVVGVVHTATTGSWNTSALSFTYQWFRNDVAIPGATKATFTPLADSESDTLWVRVTASKVGYESVSTTSAHLRVGDGAAPVATVAPRITGVARVGETLTASSGTWNTDGLTFTYEWYAAGVLIAGETDNTLVLTVDQLAQIITVKSVSSRTGYASGASAGSTPTLAVVAAI